MKKLTVLFVLAVALMVLVSAVSAAPSTYNSGFQVQNLSETDAAAIVIEFYAKDGTVAATVNDSIPANSSKTYFPLDDVSAGFDGSVVINSDQPVAAIANVLGDGFGFGASYGGFSGGEEVVSMPLIMKGNSGFDTWFNVQNAGSSATDVTISFDGQSCDQTVSIEPGAAATFDQSVNTCLPAGYVGAATASTTGGSIVATVMETGAQTLFAYNGFTGGSSNPVLPLVQANNSGYHTGVQIQNTGTASTDVTVSYSPVGSTGTACTETKTIAAGSSDTFALYAFSLNGDPSPGTDGCTFGETFIGSAAVTANSADQPLVGIVNQTNLTNKGSAYNAFDPDTATASLVMPLIMDRNSGFYTGFNVQNVGNASTAVTCSFTGSSATASATLAANEAMNELQLNAIADGYVGSATCTSDGQPIIGVVNELLPGAAGDQLFTYEATNN